jgi:predicted transcriptional regulator
MAAPPPLGPLELEVLGLLEVEPRAVASIQARLRSSGRDLAYTTVMTVLGRLCDKGVAVRKKDKNRYLYASARSAERVKGGVLRRLKQSLFRSDRLRPVVALLDGDDPLSDDELRALRAEIDARLKRGSS